MLRSTERGALSIGAVAERAHVSVAVLRAWELRFGFPEPDRAPSGHRRYSEHHVEQVRQVVRDRDAGWSLEAAIDRARDGEQVIDDSISAGLRRRRADLTVHELSTRAMLAISHAIEDEYCARAERGVLIGSFERTDLYERAAARWTELARTAVITIAFADFDRSIVRRAAPIEVGLRSDAPLLREWSVICDAPGFSACLAGIERPARLAGEGRRTFEAVWSLDPEVVRDATEAALTLARKHAPRINRVLQPLPPVATPNSGFLQRANALTSRIVAYLDA